MKAEVLQSLLVAKTLYDQARVLLYSDNKYSTSAALVILQDAFELILKAALIEKGVDEVKNFENESFDGIIALLRKEGVPVKKSGTLKAMNRERVNVKHYGQLAEHGTVQNFFDTTEIASRAIMEEVFGKALSEIYPSDLIQNAEVRGYLANAESHIAKGDVSNALLAVRMAIFVSIEEEYDIAAFADPTKSNSWVLGRGRSAPYHTRNSDWIKKNVNEPFDYIQLNHEKIKIDLMEWGVNTQDFWNIWRLTPKVYKADKSDFWQIASFSLHNDPKRDLENAKYCFDRAVNLLLKKQQHQAVGRYVPYVEPKRELLIIRDSPRLAKTDATSTVVATLKAGERIIFSRWLMGLDRRNYYQLAPDFSRQDWFNSYVYADDCQIAN